MPSFNTSAIIDTAQSKTTIQTLRSALLLKAAEVLSEQNSFPVRAQTKRYILAQRIINGDDSVIPSAAFYLLYNNSTSYFNESRNPDDIKSDFNNIQPNGLDSFNYLAGVTAQDLIK